MVSFVSFTLLPAVDVANGRSVRMVQGVVTETEPTYGPPLDVALGWQRAGAEWIHLVDLDAAASIGSNADLLAGVIGSLDVNVQLSGGINDEVSLQRALSTGCARVVLATTALNDPAWCASVIAKHGERIAVGLDVRVAENSGDSTEYYLAPRGSGRASGVLGMSLLETVAQLDAHGCHRYVVTDVGRDGMLRGPNSDLYRSVTGATANPVIASGGVSTIDDLMVLAKMATGGANLEGSIVGKALYVNRFSLSEALNAVRHFGGKKPGTPRSTER